MSSAYHPQSDSQSEALNKCLEMYLRCFTFQNPKDWYKALSWAEFWYNTSFHGSLGMTPFKALYGREPPTLNRYVTDNNDPPDVQQQLYDRDALLTQLRANLNKAQQHMKHYANKKRKDVQFKVGDEVLVKLQPYKQHSVSLRKNHKLSMRYFGPFKVVAKVGAVAYKLKLPDTAKIHSVFHVSQLKGFCGTATEPYLPLPLTTTEMGPVLMPTAILRTRTVINNGKMVKQGLIQWENYSESEATWEDLEMFKVNYPLFNLEDKVPVNGEGDVTDKGEMKAHGGSDAKVPAQQGNHSVTIQELRKSGRVRRPNRKYEE
ncbi:hypothetical protein A2U01_0013421 [Trifolium medium]|uniref:Integrase catalytic domain-containing protein n=1 Tax=Trifolium medium TaxID=97028 RepID=A0A392MY91_9FABA|nr:hypothetical protein [Trifolium medium]